MEPYAQGFDILAEPTEGQRNQGRHASVESNVGFIGFGTFFLGL